MKITIIAISKFENSIHKEVFDTYVKRLKWTIELKEFELKNAKTMPGEQVKKGEGELLLKAIKPGCVVIALDEKGKEFSSQNFAKLIANYSLNGDSHLTFIIGGANGLCPEVLARAHLKMSLSLMTFPHLMVRSILAEQLYRASTIINNHPYHRE